MFDTKESAVVETATDDDEMQGIEFSVLRVLEDRKERAISVEEMRKELQGAFTRKQLYAALYRLEQLVQESVVTVPRRLIAEAIDMIVFISGRGLARRVETIARVAGLDAQGGYAVHDLTPETTGE